MLGQSLQEGVACTEHALFDSSVKNGHFYGPSFMELKGAPKLAKLEANAKEPTIAKQLWETSERLTQIKFFP